MQLGFFTMPIHPVGRDWRETLAEDREAFLLAEELGFVEAYVGEHFTDLAETVTSAAMFLAWIGRETKSIRLGTGTINMPNNHPAMVASHIAMLDHMLNGRLNFGISPGGLMSDAECFGNYEKNRNEMLVEAINTVLKIWESEAPYNIEGKYWDITTEKTMIPDVGQGTILKPLQKPHPPIIVTAVAPFSKGVTEAAARGWDPISANFLQPQWVKTHWPKYIEGCERAERPAKPENWRVAKSIFVADDLETAKSYVMDPNGPYHLYYFQLVTKLKRFGRAVAFKKDPDMPDEDLTVEQVLEDLVIWGTPDKVADELIAFREEVGPFGTLLYAGKDWRDRDLGRRSMILLAEQVLPAVNSALSE